jgi:hypothetical protein
MATLNERLLDTLSGRGFPWVARVYFILIVLFGAVLIWTASRSSATPVGPDLNGQLFTLMADSLKTVLGALLGSLSLAAEALWKSQSAAIPQAATRDNSSET